MTSLNDVYEQALCSMNSFVYFIYLFMYLFIYLQTCQTLQEYERMTALNDVYEQALCSMNLFVYFIYLFIYKHARHCKNTKE